MSCFSLSLLNNRPGLDFSLGGLYMMWMSSGLFNSSALICIVGPSHNLEGGL